MRVDKIIILEEDKERTIDKCVGVLDDLIDSIVAENLTSAQVTITTKRNPALDRLLDDINLFLVYKTETKS